MWNDRSEKQSLEIQLASEQSEYKRIQILLSLAYIARSDLEERTERLDAVADLLLSHRETYPLEYTHYLFIKQYVASDSDQNQLAEAIPLAEDVLTRYRQLSDEIGEVHTLANLLMLHLYSTDYDGVQRYISILHDLTEQYLLPESLLARVWDMIASAYERLKLLDLAEKYCLKILDLKQTTAEIDRSRFGCLWTLSIIEEGRGNYSMALEYTQRATKIAESLNISLWITVVTTREARFCRQLGWYDEALSALHQSLANHVSQTDHLYAHAAAEFGRVYWETGQFAEAERWMQSALAIFEEGKSLYYQQVMFRELSELYFEMERYRESVEALRKYDQLRQQTLDDEVRKETAALSAQYEYQLSQKELEFARFQTEILTHRNSLLQQAYHEQKEILNIVAHDLKSPLSATKLTINQLNQLVTEQTAGELERYLNRVSSSVEHMLAIVSQLTMMGRIDANAQIATVQSVSIPRVLESVVESNHSLLHNKSIQLAMTVPTHLAGWGDKALLGQVFDNLLSNSIKYSPPYSTVHIVASQSQEWVDVAFIDKGVGMAQEEMPKLFTKFGRLSSRPTGAESSTGLGLYNSKKLIEIMNGEIVGESAGLGHGSTFTVRLRQAESV